MRADACRPRIFVHSLPPDYRDSPSDQRFFGSQPYPNGRLNQLAGSTVLPHFPPHVQLWNSGQFSNAELMYQRALVHECRVRNESMADLFFVPAFSGALRAASVSAGEHCAERGATHKGRLSNAELQSTVSASGLIERLRSVAAPHCGGRTLRRGAAPPSTDSASCSVLEARGGADHVIVNPRNGAVFESHPFCELDYLDPRFGNAVRLSIEEPPRGRWEWFDHYHSHPAYVGIPHISMVHLQRDQLSGAPWRSRHPRPQLAVGAFGIRGPTKVRQLREALRRSCQDAPPTDCYFFHTSDAFNKNKTQRFSWESKGHSRNLTPNLDSHSHALQPEKDPLWLTTAKLYWNATFCLQPPGDAVSRKGVADALVLGCIPVQFHEGMAEQWPWHWGEWQRASSVLLDWRAVLRGELDVMGSLRGIPAAQVAAMQESIAQNAHRIHYSRESLAHGPQAPRLDAFDTVMQRAWEHARNEGNARTGRHMQRKQGEEVQSVADQLMREPKQHTGYCGHAHAGMGDCGRGNSGRLPLIVANTKPARLWAARKGAHNTNPSLWQDRGQSLASVDDCIEYCQRCGQCRYISYSLVTMTCEWYRDCNTTLGLHARSYSLWHTFRTRRVK
jgi:hypothetical protein